MKGKLRSYNKLNQNSLIKNQIIDLQVRELYSIHSVTHFRARWHYLIDQQRNQ